MITQQQAEQLELHAQEARERFLGLLTSAPDVATAYQQWQAAERAVFEARRERREAEARNG
jgi:hypothetical protein